MQETATPFSLKKTFALALASAALLALSMPGWNLWPLAFFALVPWAWATLCVERRAWMVDALFALAFLSFTVWWIGYVSPVGAAAAILVATAMMLPLGWLLRRLARWMPVTLALPIAWTVVEFLRTRYPYGGLPFSQLGLSLWDFPQLIQVASLAGIHTVSFLLAAVSGLVVDAFFLPADRRPSHMGRLAILVGVFFAGAFFYASSVIPIKKLPKLLPVVAVQANIPMEAGAEEMSDEEILKKHLRLSEKAMQEFPDTELLLWPEGGYPYHLVEGARDDSAIILPGERPFRVKDARKNEKPLRDWVFRDVLRDKQTALLTGAMLFVPRGEAWSPRNAAVLLLPPEGKRAGAYHKVHLVPGGEFIPDLGPISFVVEWLSDLSGFRGQLGVLEPGEKVEVLSLPWKGEQIPFGVSICYDNAYANPYREAANQGARFHVVLSNEGWYGDSSEMDQLLAASVFRAVETRRPIVRATLSGISAELDAWGRIRGLVKSSSGERKHVEGFLGAAVDVGDSGDTLYMRIGDSPWWGLAALTLLLALLPRKNGKLPTG